MPNAEWREEKAEFVVQSICRVLASSDTPKEIKNELEGEALWNALKLFSHAVEERLGEAKPKWSPALVELFRNNPEQCQQWLEFMSEPGFSAENYWKPNS